MAQTAPTPGPAPSPSSVAPGPATGPGAADGDLGPRPPAGPPGTCRTHPGTPTGHVCGYCRAGFCERCLVELQGVRVCAWCKPLALTALRAPSGPPPEQIVAWARTFDRAVAVGGLISLALQLGASVVLGRLAGPGGGFVAGVLPWVMAAMALTGALLAVPPAFALRPGCRWAYWWQLLALIPIGLLSLGWIACVGFLVWPFAVSLFIRLLRPDVRAYCENPVPAPEAQL